MAETVNSTWVVTLNAGGGAVSDALRKEIATRHWTVSEQTDPYRAMAELCLRERDVRERSAWGMARAERVGLVVIDAEGLPEWPAMRAAMAKFAPSADVWTWSGGRLAALQSEAPARSPSKAKARHQMAEVEPAPARRTGGKPSLRLAAADGAELPPRNPEPSPLDGNESEGQENAAGANSRRLTQEEIRMLLERDVDSQETMP